MLRQDASETPALLKCLSVIVRVFIKCPKCGKYNCIREVMPQRVELALFRGSEDPVKCISCGAEMDTMTAFCGMQESSGSEVVRHQDPESW